MELRSNVRYLVTLGLFLVVSAAWATAGAPEGVSPGDARRLVATDDRCPAFNWSATESPSLFQIAVYVAPDASRHPADGDIELREDELVVSALVPGGATGWTPASDRCLTRGGSYVWFVRGVEATPDGGVLEAGEWSEGLYFRVGIGAPELDLRQGLGGDSVGKGDPPDDPWVLVTGDVMSGPLGIGTDGIGLVVQTTSDDELGRDVPKIELRSSAGRRLLTIDADGDLDANEIAVNGSTVIDGGRHWVGDGDTVPCSGCVTAGDIAGGAITTSEIANGTIATADLADASVTAMKIATGAVTGTRIADGSVTNSKIGNGAVTGSKIGVGAVTQDAIAASAVTSSKIATGAVNSSKISAGAVTSAAVADGTLRRSDVAWDGGIYASRNAIYESYGTGAVAAGSTQSVTAYCNDVTDLPLSGGCDSDDQDDITIVGFSPVFWGDPSQLAGYRCRFRNTAGGSRSVMVRIHCATVND